MDRFEPDATNETPSTVEKVPHSGVHFDEQPDLPGQPNLSPDIVDALAEKGAGFDSVPQALIDRTRADGDIIHPPVGLPTATGEQGSPAPEQPKSKRNKIIAWIAGVALVLGGGGVVTERILNANSTPEDDPKGNSQVEEDQPNQGEQTNNTPELTPEQAEMEEILNMPKPERFDELDAMTLEQFNQEPIEARVEYANWLNRDAKHLAELWYDASGNPRDELAVTMTVGPENTGEEANANVRSLQRGAITRHFEMYDLEEVPIYDSLQRQKMISASFLYPGSVGAQNWRESAANEDVAGYVPEFYESQDLILADEEVISRGDTYTYTDQAGKEYSAFDFTQREPDGTETNGTLILVVTPTVSQWVVTGE